MNDKKQIEEMANDIDKSHWKIEQGFTGCHINSDEIAKYLIKQGWRKQSDVIDEFAKRLIDAFPEANPNHRSPCLYYDEYRYIIEELAEEMKGGMNMDFSKEIKTMIEKAVKQAIDELAIKEQIRDYISSAIAKDEIVKKTDSLIDSYFRSAMNCISVEKYIKGKIDELVTSAVKKEIDDVLRSCYSGWNGREKMKNALDVALKREFEGKYKVGINIEPIAPKGE